MGDIKIFILLLLSTSCYCKSVDRPTYRNLESYEDENDHELLDDSLEDRVKAVWIDPLIKDDDDKGQELIQKEKEQDRDIFSHPKPSHFNPYSPPTKHYNQPPTNYVKPEPTYIPIDESDLTKTFKSKKTTTTPAPVRWEYLKKPELTTPKPYYAQKEFTYDNIGEEYYSPKSSLIPPRESLIPPRESLIPPRESLIPPRESLIPPRESLIPPRVSLIPPVSIEDIKNYHADKDTLILVVKVPKLPHLTKHDKIQLPPLTLDLSNDNWSDSLKTIFNKDKKPSRKTPPPVTIPPPPMKIIKHKEHRITPIDITINYVPKQKEEPKEKWYPKQKEETKEKWYPAPPAKEHHHYTKPEYLNINHQAPAHVNHHASYLNIDEKPILLADPHGQYLDIGEKPILLADPNGQYLDIGEEPMLLVDYPVHHNKYWGRKKRDTSTDSSDSINTTESNEKSEQNTQKKSTYRGELPPLEFPKMKKYKGIRVEQSPVETDAPLYFPETDDKVLSLVFGKHSNNKKTTTPTKRTVIKAAGTVSSEVYEYDQEDDNSFAPLIFPDNVKLVADDDDYKKYIPPTYFPETEADVDYKFEIRPFQQSVYDQLMRRISPLLTTPAEPVEVPTNEKLPTVTTTNDDNLIDVPDKIPYHDDDDEDEDDNFKEVKPPLYFPETSEELRAFNELYNRGRTSGHRKLKVYQKKRPHVHKD